MKSILAAAATLLLVTGLASAQTASSTSAPAVAPTTPPGEKAICLLSGTPPAADQYTVVKQLKIGKGTYGSVDEAIALLASQARQLGADAIINYSGSQRFGFFPWRFVRPVVRGTAVKWNSTTSMDCVAMGGSNR